MLNIINKILFLSLIFSVQISGQELPKYTAFSNHINIKKWLQRKQRIVDSEGILMQTKKYHALTISVYGIISYYEFLETKDSTHYNNVINQYKYFCDTSKLHFIDDNKGVGLPYTFNFHDLKAPWYSGMTQGVAISYLLRYYELTKNKEALQKVKQLVYFMLRPEEIGGAIGKTKEGFTFIEEYPNSKSKPQVLNGFINGLIGLHEYLLYFPKDTLARRVHDESYQAMVKTFKEYDKPNWTNYDRRNSSCSNHYIRYEMREIEQLNNIYHDPRLIKQQMIWAYFAHNKIVTSIKFYKYPSFQFGVPATLEEILYSTGKINFENSYTPSQYHFKKKRLLNNSKNTKKSTIVVKSNKSEKIILKDSAYSVFIKFDQKIENFTFSIKLDGNIIQQPKLNILKKDSILEIYSGSKFSSISLKLKSKKRSKVKLLSINQYSNNDFNTSRFVFHKMKDVSHFTQGKQYNINAGINNIEKGFIFYRSAIKKEGLKRVKWDIKNTIPLKQENFTAPLDGFYEFLIITPTLPFTKFIVPIFSAN